MKCTISGSEDLKTLGTRLAHTLINTFLSKIDVEMYRNRSYTDSPSPEGRSGIWRARESLFYKYGSEY
jgi:hypothetical protein